MFVFAYSFASYVYYWTIAVALWHRCSVVLFTEHSSVFFCNSLSVCVHFLVSCLTYNVLNIWHYVFAAVTLCFIISIDSMWYILCISVLEMMWQDVCFVNVMSNQFAHLIKSSVTSRQCFCHGLIILTVFIIPSADYWIIHSSYMCLLFNAVWVCWLWDLALINSHR